MESAGKIYDVQETKRINDWLNTQEGMFVEEEKQKNKKQWFYLVGISVGSAILLLLIINKKIK